jgi:hypothetical protein
MIAVAMSSSSSSSRQNPIVSIWDTHPLLLLLLLLLLLVCIIDVGSGDTVEVGQRLALHCPCIHICRKPLFLVLMQKYLGEHGNVPAKRQARTIMSLFSPSSRFGISSK